LSQFLKPKLIRKRRDRDLKVVSWKLKSAFISKASEKDSNDILRFLAERIHRGDCIYVQTDLSTGFS